MFRRFLKSLLVLAVLLVLALGVAGFLLTEPEPLVTDAAPPTSEEVAEARDFVRGLREAINPDTATTSDFVTTEAQLRSLLKLGARIVPGFRGSFWLEGETAMGQASIPVPMSGGRWLNLAATIPEFDGRVRFGTVTVGGVSMPPDLTLSALRIGANLVGGNDLGDTIVSAASRMDIAGQEVRFVVEMDGMGSNGIMRGVFRSMRGSDLPEPEEIDRYYVLIRDALEAGELPTTGSYLPVLKFALTAAHEASGREGAENAYTSALFGLALACGARDCPLLVGGLIVDDLGGGREWSTECSELTFNDRIDSRRHFTTAAAIQAASNRGFAVSVGEFKELYDSIGAGGFDFTDLAANNSGIRMSNRFMSADPATWPGLIARLETENDVIIPYDGLPQILSREDFEATYSDVDSPAYREMLARIEARIDTLALHN